MSAKPFRNSTGGNKPFRSPFNTTSQTNNNKIYINTEQNKHKTPLKVTIAKRLLFQQSHSPKKICLCKENDNNQVHIDRKKELCYSDLESLKHRIKQKEQAIHNLKTTILYKQKNKAEDLEDAITKWTEVCQNALRDYQNNLQTRSGQSVTMSGILSSFNINPDIVRFSADNDTFY